MLHFCSLLMKVTKLKTEDITLKVSFAVPSLSEDPEVNIPVDLGSGFLSQNGRLTFLTTNNTHIVAHQGSSIKLECRIDKPPNSAMVRN